MTANAELLARSAELQSALVALAESAAYAQVLQAYLEERFAGDSPDEEQRASAVDAFIYRHALEDGRTLVERFVSDRTELPDVEREMLLRWREAIDGVFVIQRRESDALLLDNLIDELMYRVRATSGSPPFFWLKEGSYIIGRLAPVQDEWIFSGPFTTFSRSQRDIVFRVAAAVAEANPPLVFRNPANVARAWEQQRKEREEFIAFFGSDLVVLPGDQVEERMRAYAHFQVHEARDSEGLTVAERAKRAYGALPPIPEPDLPENLSAHETVGVVFDEIDGLKLLPNYGQVQEAFAATEVEPRHTEALKRYLEDPEVSPRVLQRLAESSPDRASVLFARLLSEPDFTWTQHGEAALERAKAGYYASPVMPAIVALSEELARAKLGMAPSFVSTVRQRATARASKRKKRR